MPQRGRPPQPGTAEEKAAIRREKVRLYVKAHRERKKAAVNGSSNTSVTSGSRSSKSPAASDTSGGELDNSGSHESEIHSSESPPDVKPKVEEISAKSSSESWTVQRVNRNLPKKGAVQIQVPTTQNRAFAQALLGQFRGQFLPTTVQVPRQQGVGSSLVTPCSAWITNAYGIALQQDSGALKSAILAVGLALTGMQHQDDRLKVAAIDVYRRTLRQVRNDLKPLTAGTATNFLVPYLSCLAAAMFEMVHEGFSGDIMQHIKGAASLMELLPRDSHVTDLLQDLLLEDLCMWEIVFALKYRFPSPLRALRQRKAARNWIVSGDTGRYTHNATTLGDLLDGADEVSTMMSRIDELRLQPHSSAKCSALQIEIGKLARCITDLDNWAVRFHLQFGSAYVQVEEHKYDSHTQTTTTTTKSQFRSYEVAAAWVYYLTFQICAVETSIEGLIELLHANKSLTSVRATQDAAYVDGGFTNQFVNGKVHSPIIVPQIVSYAPGYEDFISGDSTLDYAPLDPSSESDFLHSKLTQLRAKQRYLSTELVNAMTLFMPIPKGIIGSSLNLFPMDRAKTMLKRELSRLNNDLNCAKLENLGDNTEIMRNIQKLSNAMVVYEDLEQKMLQSGLPPMPEDP